MQRGPDGRLMSQFDNLRPSAPASAPVLANEAPLIFGFSVGAIMKVQPDRARQFCTNVLLALDTPESTARTISSHLVEADMKNVRSHGMIRLVRYAEQIESGYIDNKAPIDIRQVAPGMLHVDANRNWGIVALDAMVPELEKVARELRTYRKNRRVQRSTGAPVHVGHGLRRRCESALARGRPAWRRQRGVRYKPVRL